MSEPVSDADKIRNKRLAKLGSQQSSPTASSIPDNATSSTSSAPIPSTSSAIPPNTEGRPTTSKATAATTSPATAQNPFAQFGVKQPPHEGSRIKITPSSANHAPKSSRPSPAAAASSKPTSKPAGVTETLETWENKVLGTTLRLTLDPKGSQDINGNKLYYVEGVRRDLEEEGQPVKLNVTLLDQALLEAASNLPRGTPLDYLLGCWKRISKQFRSMKGGKVDTARQDVIREARRLCMSYCIFAVTMPDMFGREAPPTSPLLPHLLVDPEDDRGLDHEFLVEMTSRFSEDETAQEALIIAISDLSKQLAKMSMSGDFKPYVLALRNLVRYPAIVNALVETPHFLKPGVPPQFIEVSTLLGPFFQISPLQAEVTTSYFSSPQTREKTYISNAQNALRLSLRAHQADLLDITNHIIKTSKEARERMLDWLASCVNSNHKRRAIQVDPKHVASDGFMINITVCLDQLCEPFMDATFTKIDRIDVDYLRRKPRVNIAEETKLNADQKASDDFYSQPADGQSNFISEVFFLTLAAHHYGSEAVSSTLTEMEKNLKRMEKQIAELEADRPKFANNPAQLVIFENAVKKYKDQIDKGHSYKFAVQGILLDELNQARSMQFMRYAIVWLLRIVGQGHNYPKQPLQLPLPVEQPMVFRCLPEYFLEDVVANFKFIMRNMPQVITSTQSEELVMLCITFLRSSEYVKNPYLKSGLVTLLFQGIWPVYGRQRGILGDLLNSIPFATSHLLHSLMKFYIEVENTGAHTQFYDKFNIRYEIFQIIKAIWDNTIYRERLAQESSQNVDFFVRFVNLLLNDVTFVLDESLSAFVQIYALSQELASPAAALLDATQKQEKEEALSAAQGKAKSYMQLTNETVAMLKLFTEALASAFTMPEIVQRLADMLDYNLDVMVGPKSGQLKVDKLEDYNFNPRLLLAEIVDVYLNLSGKESFIVAVARDGRSYKPANFEKATVILKSKGLKAPDQVRAWQALGERFRKAKEEDEQDEEDLGEIPDDYLDPLMATLMTDPVILPSSKATLDRSTIRSILLSDPHDPFNRAPLKVEDIVPNEEIKARIEAFKEERKLAKRDAAAAAGAGEMDTTPG